MLKKIIKSTQEWVLNWITPFYHKHKTLSRLIVGITILGLGYMLFKDSTPPPADPGKIVEVETVKRDRIQKTVTVIGTIRAHNEAVFKAKAGGTLRVETQAGQTVTKGTLLARIQSEDLDTNEALLANAVTLAQNQYDRARTLFKNKAASKSTVEEKHTSLLSAKKAFSDAKKAVGDYKIYAPFEGVVGVFKGRNGAQIKAEDPITSLYNPKDLVVDFDLPLSAAKNLKDGARVIVMGKNFNLTHVQKMLDPDTHMAPASANITCESCIIGTMVDVTVVLGEKEKAVVIPFESIFLRDGQPNVYIVKDNKSVLTSVELGIRNKIQVEIIKGLKQGDQLIVFGHNRLHPDSPVTIHQPDVPTKSAAK